jgi:hypothetical protein
MKLSNVFAVLVLGLAACTVKDLTPPADSVSTDSTAIDSIIKVDSVTDTVNVVIDSGK